MKHFLFFCHREVFRRMMVTPWTILWCSLALQGLLQLDGDTMGLFLFFSVTARPSTARW